MCMIGNGDCLLQMPYPIKVENDRPDLLYTVVAWPISKGKLFVNGSRTLALDFVIRKSKIVDLRP